MHDKKYFLISIEGKKFPIKFFQRACIAVPGCLFKNFIHEFIFALLFYLLSNDPNGAFMVERIFLLHFFLFFRLFRYNFLYLQKKS